MDTVNTTVQHDTHNDIQLTVQPEKHTAFTMYRHPITGKVHIITQHTDDGNLIAHSDKAWKEIASRTRALWNETQCLPKDKQTTGFDADRVTEINYHDDGRMTFSMQAKEVKKSKNKLVNAFYQLTQKDAAPEKTADFDIHTIEHLKTSTEALQEAGKDNRQFIAIPKSKEVNEKPDLNKAADLWRDPSKPLDKDAMKAALRIAHKLSKDPQSTPLKHGFISLRDHNNIPDLHLDKKDRGYLVVEMPDGKPPVGFIIDKELGKVIFVDPEGKKLDDHKEKHSLEKIQKELISLLNDSKWYEIHKKITTSASTKDLPLEGHTTLESQGRALINFFALYSASTPSNPVDSKITHTDRSNEIANLIAPHVKPIPAAVSAPTQALQAASDLRFTNRQIEESTIGAYCDLLKKHHSNFDFRQVSDSDQISRINEEKGLYFYRTSGNHYVFFFVDNSNQNLYYYDSMGVPLNDRLSSSNFKAITKKIRGAHSGYTLREPELSGFHHQNAAPDAIQCGPYGLLFAKQMVRSTAPMSTAYESFVNATIMPASVKDVHRESLALELESGVIN